MFFELSTDLKTALRAFTRAPGTTAVIVMTLAFAIAAATIGFAFADLAILRGLPVDDTSTVVSVSVDDAQGSMRGAYRISGADFLDYQARATTLDQLTAFRYGSAALIHNGQSRTLGAGFTTANFFGAMGQPAVAGRTFSPDDDREGAAPVVVLAHHYWQREFAGRADAIGRTMQIGREHYTVIGVATPAIEFGNIAEIEVWVPLRIAANAQRDQRNLRFLARLKDGVTFDQASAEMATIGAALANDYPATNGGWSVRLVPVNDLVGGDGFWVVIALFMLSIGLLMAIATANVSNLVMVRTLARAREMAVRTALGARKGRLIRQFVTEGMVLSAIAAALSLPLAWAALQAVAAMSSEQVFQQLNIDLHEVTFVAILALICPLMFSLSPIRMMLRPDLRQVLAAGGSRGATGTGRGRSTLVVVQMALAVILLTASSLALRSMREMYSAPTGLESAKMLRFVLEFNDAQYPTSEEAQRAALATRDSIAALPGIESAAMVNALPILGDQGPVGFSIDGEVPTPTEARRMAVLTQATHDAGRTFGLKMLAGRWWHEGETGVAIVSKETATRYFGGVEPAMGRRISLTQGDKTAEAQVIGIVSDVAHTNRTFLAPPRMWIPLDPQVRRLNYLLRADHPAALISSVRSVVASTAAAVPLESLETFDDALAEAASSDYTVIGLLAGFAGLALVLASTGLFGVVSYTAAQRTAEFGTRIALGASAGDVARLVARDSAVLLGVGLTLGLAGGISVGFLMKSMLFGLSPLDPATLGGVVVLLSVVTITATVIPASRASRIDPVIALRAE